MKLRINYNKRPLFRKYLNISVIVTVLSFIVLGLVLMFTVVQYFNVTKKSELDESASSVASFISENVRVSISPDGQITVSYDKSKYLEQSLELLAEEIDGDVFITDLSGEVVLCAQNSKYITNSTYISQDIINEIEHSRYYFSQTTLDDIYEDTMYVSAVPVYYSGSTIIGVVFVTSATSQINTFTEIMLRIFAISAIAALFISILAIALFSYNMVKPLQQMADAARKFGKGDFSIRVSESANDEIGDLAVAFNNMAESLESAENVRKSFVANVSHELKTPMTTIAGFIDGILDGTIPPENQNHYLSIVSDEVRRLSRLVQSMLDLSRIDSGELRLNYQQFDIMSTLLTILLTFEQEIEKRQIEIHGLDSMKPIMVYGDPDLIHQAIYNLVENAVKFTDRGGYIEFIVEDWAERTTFSIKNSGKGVDQKELSLIFERFYKTDKSRAEDKKGLGLGLYLVKTIVLLHGGEITVESEPSQYCQFTFFIPKRQVNNSKKQKSKE